jgi:uncharacterized protein YoaH (UPF0181 family)
MSITERVDELISKGVPVGQAIAQAVTEKHSQGGN